MFWLRIKKNIFLLRTLNLSPDLYFQLKKNYFHKFMYQIFKTASQWAGMFLDFGYTFGVMWIT